MSDILKMLEDLHKQATTEHSHYYVADCCLHAIVAIKNLRNRVEYLESTLRTNTGTR